MVEIVFTSAIHDTSLKFKVVLHSLLYIYPAWSAYIFTMVGIYTQDAGYICPINREYMTRAVLPSILSLSTIWR